MKQAIKTCPIDPTLPDEERDDFEDWPEDDPGFDEDDMDFLWN